MVSDPRADRIATIRRALVPGRDNSAITALDALVADLEATRSDATKWARLATGVSHALEIAGYERDVAVERARTLQEALERISGTVPSESCDHTDALVKIAADALAALAEETQ